MSLQKTIRQTPERTAAAAAYRTTCVEVRVTNAAFSAARPATRLPSATPYIDLCREAQSISVVCHHPYAVRDAMRARGWSYDGCDHVWYILCDTVADARAVAEATAADTGIQLGQ